MEKSLPEVVKEGADRMGNGTGEASSCAPAPLWTASKGVESVGSVEGVEGVEKVGVAGSAPTNGEDCDGEAGSWWKDEV